MAPDWLVRTGLTLVFALLVVLAAWAMRRSWDRRAARMSDLPPLPAAHDFAAELEVAGRYLATTSAGDWLDRVTANGLGAPSRAVLALGPQGVLVERAGSDPFWIAREQVEAVRTDRAIAGKAFERDGIAVITWRHGGRTLDTGFRADTTEDHLRLLAACGDWNQG